MASEPRDALGSQMADMETRSRQTWFGANAKVTIGPGFLHRTGLCGLMIPHPPLANWLLRRGLPTDISRKLSFSHEFAHLQTAPVLPVYMLVMLGFAFINSQIGLLGILLVLAGVHSAWEIVSEGVVVLADSAAYDTAYKGIARLPRILFWTAGGTIAAAGWAAVLYG